MKKGKVYDLEVDASEPRTDISMLMFHNVSANYVFVDNLNHLYDLSLSRIDDLNVDGASWPLFTCYVSLQRLHYYIIERPVSHRVSMPLWTVGHKLLIVRGECAKMEVDKIHEEFSMATEPSDPLDLIEVEHYSFLNEMRSDFTTTTPVDCDAEIPSTLSDRVIHDYKRFYALLSEILDNLELQFL